MKSRKHLIQFTNKFQGFNQNIMQLLGKKKIQIEPLFLLLAC